MGDPSWVNEMFAAVAAAAAAVVVVAAAAAAAAAVVDVEAGWKLRKQDPGLRVL